MGSAATATAIVIRASVESIDRCADWLKAPTHSAHQRTDMGVAQCLPPGGIGLNCVGIGVAANRRTVDGIARRCDAAGNSNAKRLSSVSSGSRVYGGAGITVAATKAAPVQQTEAEDADTGTTAQHAPSVCGLDSTETAADAKRRGHCKAVARTERQPMTMVKPAHQVESPRRGTTQAPSPYRAATCM